MSKYLPHTLKTSLYKIVEHLEEPENTKYLWGYNQNVILPPELGTLMTEPGTGTASISERCAEMTAGLVPSFCNNYGQLSLGTLDR